LALIEKALASLAAFAALDPWVKSQLEALVGQVASAAALDGLKGKLRAALALARAVYAQALAALERKYSAGLAFHLARTEAETALLDCSFDLTDEGMSAYRKALSGDIADLAGAHLRRATLTDQLSGQSAIELALPFLDRGQWSNGWEALAKAEIECTADGRLVVYTVDAADSVQRKQEYQSRLALSGGLLAAAARRESNFTVSYSTTRTGVDCSALAPILAAYGFDAQAQTALASAADGSTSLALSIPGELVACWLNAPAERDPGFFDAYSAVSRAVQQALRNWLPYLYFADLERYGDLGAAWPLVLYGCTRPFRGRPRSEFTYDVMDPERVAQARRSALRALPAELERIAQLLAGAGRTAAARFYAPGQEDAVLEATQRQPRLFQSLLAADAFFVDSLVHLGNHGRGLTAALERDPRVAVRELARFSAAFVTAFHRRLRRLYGGDNFVALGSLLLVEATRALASTARPDAAIAGVLRLANGDASRTFVNAAFRP
jgi:hypothetical protein